jgi:hypothetical protein
MKQNLQQILEEVEHNLIKSCSQASLKDPAKGRYVVCIIPDSVPNEHHHYYYRECSHNEHAIEKALEDPTRLPAGIIHCCAVGLCAVPECAQSGQIHGMIRTLTSRSSRGKS